MNLVFQNAKNDVGGVSWVGISGLQGCKLGVVCVPINECRESVAS